MKRLLFKLTLFLLTYPWIPSIIIIIWSYQYFLINDVHADAYYEEMYRKAHQIPERTLKEQEAYLQSIIDQEEKIEYWIPKVMIAIPVCIFVYATITYFIPK